MNKDSASFCISIDLELAWGVSDKLNEFYLNHAINSERLICNKLIEIFIIIKFLLVGQLCQLC